MKKLNRRPRNSPRAPSPIKPPRHDHVGLVPLRKANRKRDTCTVCSLGELDRGPEIVGQRLLDDHVLSGSRRLGSERGVQMMRHRKQDGIHVSALEELLAGRRDLGTVGLARHCLPVHARVVASNELLHSAPSESRLRSVRRCPRSPTGRCANCRKRRQRDPFGRRALRVGAARRGTRGAAASPSLGRSGRADA